MRSLETWRDVTLKLASFLSEHLAIGEASWNQCRGSQYIAPAPRPTRHDFSGKQSFVFWHHQMSSGHIASASLKPSWIPRRRVAAKQGQTDDPRMGTSKKSGWMPWLRTSQLGHGSLKDTFCPFETCCFFRTKIKGHHHLPVAMFRCTMHPDPSWSSD